MNPTLTPYPYVAFAGDNALARGDLPSVAIAVSPRLAQMVVGLVVLIEIGGDALRDRHDEQRHRRRDRARRDQLRS